MRLNRGFSRISRIARILRGLGVEIIVEVGVGILNRNSLIDRWSLWS